MLSPVTKRKCCIGINMEEVVVVRWVKHRTLTQETGARFLTPTMPFLEWVSQKETLNAHALWAQNHGSLET